MLYNFIFPEIEKTPQLIKTNMKLEQKKTA